MLGVGGAKTTGSLVLRKTPNGLQVEGDAPEHHEFPRRYLERELNQSVRIRVVIPVDPPLVYEITGLQEHYKTPGWDLVGDLVPNENVPRRRWWHRFRRRK
jgi:hypothetical protein